MFALVQICIWVKAESQKDILSHSGNRQHFVKSSM